MAAIGRAAPAGRRASLTTSSYSAFTVIPSVPVRPQRQNARIDARAPPLPLRPRRERRAYLLLGVAALLTQQQLHLPPYALAANVSPLIELVPYTDPARRFLGLVPAGWRAVNLPVAGGGSILASFYNPNNPGAETLAVFVTAPASDAARRGDAKALGDALAAAAPNASLEAYSASTRADGRRYASFRVQFGGNTAGAFGAVQELRVVAAVDGAMFTLRATTTRYRWLSDADGVRRALERAADAFVLGDGAEAAAMMSAAVGG